MAAYAAGCVHRERSQECGDGEGGVGRGLPSQYEAPGMGDYGSCISSTAAKQQQQQPAASMSQQVVFL